MAALADNGELPEFTDRYNRYCHCPDYLCRPLRPSALMLLLYRILLPLAVVLIAADQPCAHAQAPSPGSSNTSPLRDVDHVSFSNAADGDPTKTFDVGYHKGLFVRVKDGQDSFELKTNMRIQFRGSSFVQQRSSWTDSAGVVRTLRDRNGFDTERARLIFSGHAFDPRLKFLLQFDGDHDEGHTADFFDYWWGWELSDTLQVQFGKRKVSASRNWLLGAFDTRLVDRPYATDFFRPGRSVGIWLVGNPTNKSHYELAITDGYRTDNLTPFQTSSKFAFSGTGWWDALGKYGSAAPSDFACHSDPALRLGLSCAHSSQGERGRALRDANFFRLTDGTRLTDPGALGPGTRVEQFDTTFVSMDAGWKHAGRSLNGEYFLRSASDIRGNLPLIRDHVFQHGFFVEGGCFLKPKCLEVNAHVAHVRGNFGRSNAVAAGFSWYPRRTQYLKLQVDTTLIDGSPVNTTGSDVLVGDNGVLVRVQMHARF